MEGNSLKFDVRRAIKTLRFTFHQSLQTTPFQMFTGQRPRNVLDQFSDLERPGRTLTTVVEDVNGRVIGSDSRVPEEIEQFESSRLWGRSRNLQELRRFVNERSKIEKPALRKVRKYVVEKTRNRKGWESKFRDKPLKVTGESKHTVAIGNRTLHKKM